MSIIIRGGRMPSECRVCAMTRYFSATGTTVCIATLATLANNYKTIQFEGRHEKCPLVELPEKHGKLVDADALIEDIRKNSESYFADDFAHEWVNRQPIIVEAEGEDA